MRWTFGDVVSLTITVLIAIALMIHVMLFATFNEKPPSLEPGMKVEVLQEKTIVVDSTRSCQLSLTGFVSQTSPEGDQDWYDPNRFLFPTHEVISIVFENNDVAWVPLYLVVNPDDYPYDLCPK